jgi:hypothetical protein
MKQINVEQTAQVIDRMSERAQYLMRELDSIADKMRRSKDLLYASEAQNAVITFFMNARLDLLISRPINELMKEE